MIPLSELKTLQQVADHAGVKISRIRYDRATGNGPVEHVILRRRPLFTLEAAENYRQYILERSHKNPRSGSPKSILTAYVPSKVCERLTAEADALEISRSTLVADILQEWIGSDESKKLNTLIPETIEEYIANSHG